MIALVAVLALSAGVASGGSLPQGLIDDLVTFDRAVVASGGQDCRLDYVPLQAGRLIAFMGKREVGNPRALARVLVARRAPYASVEDRDLIADAVVAEASDAERTDTPWGGPIQKNPALAQQLAAAATQIGRLDVPRLLEALHRLHGDARLCPPSEKLP